MVASSCLGGPEAVIKYLMDAVCSGWGLGPHAFRLDGGQGSHCNVVAVSVVHAVWPGVCVFEPRLWGAKSVVWSLFLLCCWAASDRMLINKYSLLS